MIVLAVVPAVLQIVGMQFCPESPRYLLTCGDRRGALDVRPPAAAAAAAAAATLLLCCCCCCFLPPATAFAKQMARR